jgi:hypothetical protein
MLDFKTLEGLIKVEVRHSALFENNRVGNVGYYSIQLRLLSFGYG